MHDARAASHQILLQLAQFAMFETMNKGRLTESQKKDAGLLDPLHGKRLPWGPVSSRVTEGKERSSKAD